MDVKRALAKDAGTQMDDRHQSAGSIDRRPAVRRCPLKHTGAASRQINHHLFTASPLRLSCRRQMDINPRYVYCSRYTLG